MELKNQMNLRLLVQTMGPLLAVGTLALLAGIFAANQVQTIRQRGNRIVSENIASIRAAESMEATVLEVRYRLKRFLSNNSERHLEEIQPLLRDLTRSQLEIRRTSATETERQRYHALSTGIDQLKAELLRLDTSRVAPREPALAERVLLICDEVIPAQIIEPLQAYIQENEDQLQRKSDRNHMTANQLTVGFVVLGVLGGFAGLISGYLLARRLNKTLVQLSIPVHATAGALHQVTQPIHVAHGGGFRSLEATMQEVESHVRTVVERLQRSEREILRTEQLAAMGQMAAGLGHELRNPLTSVKAILQLADEPSQLTDRDLSVLKQEMQRLEHGLHSFLDFARPARPFKRQADIRPAVLQTLALVSRRAENKEVQLTSNVQEAPLRGMADVGQIRQVILNLILNAIEAVAIGGHVDVECQSVRAGTNGDLGEASPTDPSMWCLLRIRDNGPGLPKDLGEKIFEPFVSTKDAGLGLGLSICKRIIQSHGGTLIARDIKHDRVTPADAKQESHFAPFPAADTPDFFGGAEFLVTLPLEPMTPILNREALCTP